MRDWHRAHSRESQQPDVTVEKRDRRRALNHAKNDEAATTKIHRLANCGTVAEQHPGQPIADDDVVAALVALDERAAGERWRAEEIEEVPVHDALLHACVPSIRFGQR